MSPPLMHIVLFEFKPEVSDETKIDICKRMLALKDECLHPKTGLPYIRTSSGGKDSSPEGHQRGITHAFIVEFENKEDCKHYLEVDPAHQAFAKSAGPLMTTVQVVDYTPDVF